MLCRVEVFQPKFHEKRGEIVLVADWLAGKWRQSAVAPQQQIRSQPSSQSETSRKLQFREVTSWMTDPFDRGTGRWNLPKLPLSVWLEKPEDPNADPEE